MSGSKICPILSAKIMSQSKEELPVIVQLKDKNKRLKDGIMNLSTKVKCLYLLLMELLVI